MSIESVAHRHHWKVHLQHSHLLAMVEVGGETTPVVGGETTPEAEEEVLPEERIRIQVNQVVIGLINQKSNVISIRNLVIMHMNAGRNNMTKEDKDQIN